MSAAVAEAPKRVLHSPVALYVGRGPGAREFIAKLQPKSMAHVVACDALRRELGADALDKTRCGVVVAFAYEAEPTQRPQARTGLQFKVCERLGDGRRLHLYRPDASPEGCAITDRIRAIGAFNWSDEACKALGLPEVADAPMPAVVRGSVRTVAHWASLPPKPVAGTTGGMVFLQLPFGPVAERFSPPEWMTWVTRDQYQAAFEEAA